MGAAGRMREDRGWLGVGVRQAVKNFRSRVELSFKIFGLFPNMCFFLGIITSARFLLRLFGGSRFGFGSYADSD